MQVLVDKLAEWAGIDLDKEPKPAAYQKAQEQAWLQGWYRKARNNRPQRSKTTHVKRRTKR
jgi:hypothetical protein